MTRAMGEDLRWQVARLVVETGLSTREAARRMCVGIATVGSWVRLYRSTGGVTPGKRGNLGRSCLDEHEAFILDLIEARRDLTLGEMVQCLDEAHGLRVQPSTLRYFLNRRDLTSKKGQATPANRTGRMSTSAA